MSASSGTDWATAGRFRRPAPAGRLAWWDGVSHVVTPSVCLDHLRALGPLAFRWTTVFREPGGPTARKWSKQESTAMTPLNNLTRASVAPVPSRSISGDPVRRGAAILISSEAVARRSGSARSWAGADPSPACAMRARRNEIHLGSRHAGSARQNPPALNPREPASHNAIPGDITKTTPPPGRARATSPGRAPGPHAPWEGVRSSAPWLPVPCVRTGSQPRRGATVEVAPPRER